VFELGTDGPSQILVGVDGSESSMRAGAYATGLARRQGAKIICLYVHQIPPLMAASPSATAAALQMNRAIADELRASILEATPRLGVHITFLETTGRPFDELVRVADELRVDAVVVGASTSGGRRLVGSIAMRLVKAARWPVTVVP
jgi:nucleotide-binding universal stress UspA family protein